MSDTHHAPPATPPSLARRLRERLYPHRHALKWLRPLVWHPPLPLPPATHHRLIRYVYALTRDDGDDGLWYYPGTSTCLMLDRGEFVQHSIYYNGVYQPHVFARFQEYLQPGTLFIDVGAHIGQYAIWAAAVARQHAPPAPLPAVLAFEPDPRIVWRLRNNVRFNDLEPYVQVLEQAVSDQAGSSSFFLDTEIRSGMSGLRMHNHSEEHWQGDTQITVACITLDQAVAQHAPQQPVGMIKLDVEGAELLALRGAQHTLHTHQPVLLLEACRKFMHTFDYDYGDLQAFLRGHGYQIWLIGDDGNLHPDASEALPRAHVHDLLCLPEGKLPA